MKIRNLDLSVTRFNETERWDTCLVQSDRELTEHNRRWISVISRENGNVNGDDCPTAGPSLSRQRAQPG
ncbi:hypothetical protein QLX08_000417 [Tetragonisca angustula]|uniref:Uncharacterized protein n=1 Tax=Tetragonisca angustula TaxID=166442 RepID=A0AAW1AJJ7_9HYME